MQARPASRFFKNASLLTLRIKSIEIVEAQTAAEPACGRIEFGMGEELEPEASLRKDHPALVAVIESETQRSVELRRSVEIA